MHKMSFHSNMLSKKCHTVSLYSDERLQYHRVSCFKNHLSVLFFPICKHGTQTPFSPRIYYGNHIHGWIVSFSLKDDLLSAIPMNDRHVRMESAEGHSLMPTPPRQAAPPPLPWSIFNLVRKLSRINEAICQTFAFMRQCGKCYGKSGDTLQITSVEIPTVKLKQKRD